jgi:hypothetical protein
MALIENLLNVGVHEKSKYCCGACRLTKPRRQCLFEEPANLVFKAFLVRVAYGCNPHKHFQKMPEHQYAAGRVDVHKVGAVFPTPELCV